MSTFLSRVYHPTWQGPGDWQEALFNLEELADQLATEERIERDTELRREAATIEVKRAILNQEWEWELRQGDGYGPEYNAYEDPWRLDSAKRAVRPYEVLRKIERSLDPGDD